MITLFITHKVHFCWTTVETLPCSTGGQHIYQMEIKEALHVCRSEYTDLGTIYNDNENSELAY